MLVERIDEDKDGYVTVEEMKKWIKHAQKKWIYDDVDRQWKSHDLDEDGVVSWDEYKKATYGYIMGMSVCTAWRRWGTLFILLLYTLNPCCRWLRPWRWLQLQADDGSWWEEIQNGRPRQRYESKQGRVYSFSPPWGVWPHERYCCAGEWHNVMKKSSRNIFSHFFDSSYSSYRKLWKTLTKMEMA